MRGNFFSFAVLSLLFFQMMAVAQPSVRLKDSDQLALNELSDKTSAAREDFKLEYYFELLDSKTPLDLELNPEVKRYIDLFLGNRRRDLELSLQRSQLYFPIIEQMLDKYDLPIELKYLAVIESGLNPLARSSSGAVGLWQILYTTCSLFDLNVDSYIDERCDPYKSTEAACKYLRYLYRTYHDWNLVMASYNGGPGEVRKAIERSGGKTDYWEIRPYLSYQSKNYVPAFMAIAYLMNYYEIYGVKAPKARIIYEYTDTLMLSYAVSFSQITANIDISLAELEFLNPSYRKDYIPDRETPCILVLPKDLIIEYIRNESKIISSRVDEPDYNQLVATAGATDNRSKIIHTVKQGEFCHKIAMNYDCTIENIKAWNKLSTTNLYPGQTLDIWVNSKKEIPSW